MDGKTLDVLRKNEVPALSFNIFMCFTAPSYLTTKYNNTSVLQFSDISKQSIYKVNKLPINFIQLLILIFSPLRSISSSIGILDFDPAPCMTLLWSWSELSAWLA